MFDRVKSPGNSFICDECGKHQFDGNMSVLSCTQYYDGLICIDCAHQEHPELLAKALLDREISLRAELSKS